MKEYDIAVIGAGVIGCAIARELSRYDWQTVVLEKNLEVGEGATKANSAIVHGGYDPIPGTLKAKLNVAGGKMIRELSMTLDFPYKPIGSLVLAFNEADEAILRELLERGAQNGAGGLSILSRGEVLELEPNVSKDVTSALLCTEAAIVSPFNLTYALIENAMANGVDLNRGWAVQDIIQEESGFLIKTSKADIRSKLIINAAGIQADQIAGLLGEADYIIKPRKGEYRVLDKSEGKTVGHVIFQTPTPLGKGILVTPTVYGNLMIGPDYIEATATDSLTPSITGLQLIDRQAKRSVPGLKLERTIRIFAGLRATTDQGDFLIYQSNTHPGFFHAAGIDSPGLSSSPAIAAEMLQLVLASGLLPARLKPNFISERVNIKVGSTLTAGETAATRLLQPDDETIVCRCEGVTEAEIRQAIKRPGGPVTIDGVKRRIRPGMGKCQGAYCRSRVTKLLAEEQGIAPDEVLKDSKELKEHLKK